LSVETQIRLGVGRSTERGADRSVMAALITQLVRGGKRADSVMGEANGRGYSRIPTEVNAVFTTCERYEGGK
jgi:hypothetical protein